MADMDAKTEELDASFSTSLLAELLGEVASRTSLYYIEQMILGSTFNTLAGVAKTRQAFVEAASKLKVGDRTAIHHFDTEEMRLKGEHIEPEAKFPPQDQPPEAKENRSGRKTDRLNELGISVHTSGG